MLGFKIYFVLSLYEKIFLFEEFCILMGKIYEYFIMFKELLMFLVNVRGLFEVLKVIFNMFGLLKLKDKSLFFLRVLSSFKEFKCFII